MKSILLVAGGGAIGSVLRYLMALCFKPFVPYVFPWHTFAVNLIGCFCIGMLLAYSFQHTSFDNLRLFLMIGVLGGFTTFSSFGLETFSLIREKQLTVAITYVISTNILGFLLVYLGYALFKIN